MEKSVEVHWLLDLPRDASPEEVEQRCDALMDWLESDSIPEDMRSWASRQAELIQEIHGSAGHSVAIRAVQDRPAEDAPRRRPSQASRDVTEGEGRNLLLRLWARPLFAGAAGVVLGLAVLGGLWWGGVIFDSDDEAASSSDLVGADSGQLLASRQARIEELERAVVDNPDDPDILFELGETNITIENWDESILWFEKLLEVDPTNLHAQIDIGTAHMNMGRDSQAEAAFNKALEMDPDSAQVHYNLGFLFAFRQDAPDLDEAIGHWEDVIRLEPDSDLAAVSRVHIDQFQAMTSGSAE